MWKWSKIIFTGIVVSMFLFPFEFSFLRGVNTKMAMAALGVVVSAYYLIQQRSLEVPRYILLLFIFAGCVSLVGVFSITFNHTSDTAYVSYIISMAVWLSAAFVVCCCIRAVHGHLDVVLLTNYLVAVCVAQCALALLIDNIPHFKSIVDTYIQQDQELLTEINRLYGIGAWLDVAGSRFAAVLVIVFFVMHKNLSALEKKDMYVYVASIIIMVVVGCMISRTTIVGLLLGFIPVLFLSDFWTGKVSSSTGRLLVIVAIVLVAGIAIITYFYRTNPEIRSLLRFAFEGFFNFVETGTWETSSTNRLQTMYVFPDNIKTWIIGDGYFINPRGDINYLGDSPTGGYYMGTDVGYLRFIFYFGLVGLAAFLVFMIYSTSVCCDLTPEYRLMFWLILVVGLVVWLKVATDIFCVLALFICCGLMSDETSELVEV